MSARVLVVEDEDSLRLVVSRTLTAHCYAVSEAGSVEAALRQFATFEPGVLLLDINLPDGSGWDVLRAIDARGAMRPAVVAYSAVQPTPHRLDEFAPLTVLLKPFPMPALLRAIERANQATEGSDHVSANSAPI